MTAFAWIGIVIVLGLLCLVTVIQLLYAESLRLRARDLPALQFFKDTLEARIGVSTEKGVLVFSLIKHTLLLMLGICFLAAGMDDGGRHWQSFFEAVLFAWLSMLASTYIFAQLLYRKTKGHWLIPFAPVLRVCALLVRPLAAILGFFESLVELAEPGSVSPEVPNVAGDIEALISAGEEEGIIEKDDRKLIESVVAFGDNHNDIGMLRFAGLGVAMGNAHEEVKAEADYVTLSNAEDGVAIAIEEMVLSSLGQS